MWSFIADTNGSPLYKIQIDSTKNSNFDNMFVGIYPMFVYTPKGSQFPISLSAVSQDKFKKSGNDSMINGFRLFTLDKFFNSNFSVTQNWEYPLASATYPITSSFHISFLNKLFVAFQTSSYSFLPPILKKPPLGKGDSTFSNGMYSIELQCDSVLNNKPTWGFISSRKVPNIGDENGESISYFINLYSNPSSINDTLKPYKLITKNHNNLSSGDPSLILVSAEKDDGSNFGFFKDTDARNKMWTVVTGNVDGTLPDSKKDILKFPNNRGDEIIASISNKNNEDELNNKLYLFRNSIKAKGSNPGSFHNVVQQKFSGKLHCSCDIIKDEYDRMEIITSDKDVLNILQLRNYDDDSCRYNTDFPQPFKLIKSFKLGSTIKNVIVSDLDNDGENDLIVNTETSTFCIGKIPNDKIFSYFKSEKNNYCWGDKLTLKWNKNYSLPESGFKIKLKGKDIDSTIVSNYSVNKSNDSINLIVPEIEGNIKYFIQDEFLPNHVDSTIEIQISRPKIEKIVFDKSQYFVGDKLKYNLELSCLDSIVSEVSFDKINWKLIPKINSNNNNEINVESLLEHNCGNVENYFIYFKLSDSKRKALTYFDSILVKTLKREILIEPNSNIETRKRFLKWNKQDFSCEFVSISIKNDTSKTWIKLKDAPTNLETTEIYLDQNYIGDYSLKICCENVTTEYSIVKAPTGLDGGIETSDMVAPNPFNPYKDYQGCTIVYTPKSDGVLNSIIYDASGTITYKFNFQVLAKNGKKIVLNWIGKNLFGDYVAEGTYICIIKVGENEKIVLPIIVQSN